MSGIQVQRSLGAGAGQSLMKYLTQREAERRQAMLDEIERGREERLSRATDATIENTRANTKSLDEQRAAAVLAREEATRAGAVRRAGETYQIGDALAADSDVPPELRSKGALKAQTMALPISGVVPGVVSGQMNEEPPIAEAAPAVAGPVMAAQELGTGLDTFKGTADQRTAATTKADADTQLAVFQRLVDDPNTPADVKLAAQFALGGKTVPTELLKPEEEQQGVFSINPRTGKMENLGSVPKGSHFSTVPQTPMTVNMGSGAVDIAAWQYLQSGTMPPLGMGASNMRVAILERASALAQEHGINPQANAASMRADQASLTQVSKSLSAITAFENTAQRNIGLMQDAMKKITDTGIPILNRPLRTVQGMTGSPDIARFNAALRVVIPEVARILTQPNLTGQLTDDARHEMEAVVRGEATVEQMNAVVGLLIQDMQGRKTDLTAQKKAIEGAINDRGPQGTPGVVAPATAGDGNDPLGLRR